MQEAHVILKVDMDARWIDERKDRWMEKGRRFIVNDLTSSQIQIRI